MLRYERYNGIVNSFITGCYTGRFIAQAMYNAKHFHYKTHCCIFKYVVHKDSN